MTAGRIIAWQRMSFIMHIRMHTCGSSAVTTAAGTSENAVPARARPFRQSAITEITVMTAPEAQTAVSAQWQVIQLPSSFAPQAWKTSFTPSMSAALRISRITLRILVVFSFCFISPTPFLCHSLLLPPGMLPEIPASETVHPGYVPENRHRF